MYRILEIQSFSSGQHKASNCLRQFIVTKKHWENIYGKPEHADEAHTTPSGSVQNYCHFLKRD
jgi:hypothetical protein